MSTRVRHVIRTAVDGILESVLPPALRLRLAYHILNRELGDGIGDPALNGEADLIFKVKQKLRERPAVVFDVGANVGAWTTEFARGMTRELRIFSFEPVPATFAKLSANLRADAFPADITPIQAALSDREGHSEIHLAGDLAETSSLHYRSGVTDAGVIAIDRVRGDEFCKSQGITRIDMVKIDVEGHEFAVLRGFESMLREQRIGCVQFEYGRTWIDSRTFLADACEFLSSRGYRLGKIMPGKVRSIAAYEPSLDGFRFANFVAVTPEWAQLLLDGE